MDRKVMCFLVLRLWHLDTTSRCPESRRKNTYEDNHLYPYAMCCTVIILQYSISKMTVDVTICVIKSQSCDHVYDIYDVKKHVSHIHITIHWIYHLSYSMYRLDTCFSNLFNIFSKSSARKGTHVACRWQFWGGKAGWRVRPPVRQGRALWIRSWTWWCDVGDWGTMSSLHCQFHLSYYIILFDFMIYFQIIRLLEYYVRQILSYIILHIPSIIYHTAYPIYHIWPYIIIYHIYHHISSAIIIYHIIIYRHVSSYIIIYRHVSSYIIIYIFHHISYIIYHLLYYWQNIWLRYTTLYIKVTW